MSSGQNGPSLWCQKSPEFTGKAPLVPFFPRARRPAVVGTNLAIGEYGLDGGGAE